VRSRAEWIKFAITRLGGLIVDIAALGAAYLGAFILRFDFQEPRWGWRATAMSFVTVAAVSLFSVLVCGCYRFSWRHFRLRDVPRFLFAAILACTVLTVLRFLTPFDAYLNFRPPYTITLIYSMLSFFALALWRALWSWYAKTLVCESDLLERVVRQMDSSAAVDFLRDKTVMVTGAGGSIGSEIVRQVAIASPKLVLMVERGENALYEIDREMRQRGTGAELKPLMIDVNDERRMREIFELYRPDIVLHAAAYKHVPMVEMNPQEGERNNTEATKKLASLASEFGVGRFVLISTDKAVNPVSVMG
jgi:FlaA1/EpsC-like NDP-sugar epimerase